VTPRSLPAKIICLVLCCCALFVWAINGAGAGSAVGVPREARAVIDEALSEIEARREKEQQQRDIAEAEQYVRETEEEAMRAESRAIEAREEAELARREAADAEAAKLAAEAEANEAAARASRMMDEAAAAQLAAGESERLAMAGEAVAVRRDRAGEAVSGERETLIIPLPSLRDAGSERGLRVSDELLRAEAEAREQERVLREGDAARGEKTPPRKPARVPLPADWSAVRRAYARAEALQSVANAASERAERAVSVLDAKIASADEAASRLEDALLILGDARQALAEYEAYAADAREQAARTLKERDDFLAMLASPPPASGLSAGVEHYHWGGGERGGDQTVFPIYYEREREDFSWGVFTQYVMTDHLDTFTDTTLNFSKRVPRERSSWLYSLSINIPTGKSALGWDERYARVTDDITGVEQFGKGWQVTPGVAYTWKTSASDDWTIGTSYTFSEKYDPTSDIPNDDVDPGGEWGQYLRYRHLGEKWQFVGELLHSGYGRSRLDDGSSYRESDSWEGRLTFNRVLSDTQNLMFYYWLERQSPSDIPFETDDPLVHFFGTRWTRRLDENSKLHLTADVMTTDGSRFFRMYSYYDAMLSPAYGAEMVDGRTKYSLGIGFDRGVGADMSLSVGIEAFHMRDGRSNTGAPARNYNGGGARLVFYKTF